ncbi:glycogen synthase [Patescibacteria group bacterium]|nr:glycogen synthase [Patescibacteria group bacterium]
MKILFVASEVHPILKVGGIADVVGSLTKEIKKSGHDVRVAMPFYQPLKDKKIKPLNKVASLQIEFNKTSENINIFETFIPGTEKQTDVPVYLFENNRYLSNKSVYLDTKSFLYLKRFLFFSQAVLRAFPALNWKPDIIHCHDWQAGLIPLLLKIKQKQSTIPACPAGRNNQQSTIKTLFTIHNLLIQGRWNYTQVLKCLNLKGNEIPSLSEKMQGSYGDDFNVLQQAILNSDLINVVSPGYANEIKTDSYYARGLENVIQKRKKDLIGILNGIDTDFFNPETDQFIKRIYSIKRLDLKNFNKLDLQKKVNLKQDVEIPLFSMISRLDIQKGIDLVSQAVDEIVKMGGQIVFLGTGQKEYETILEKASKKHPGRVAACIKFDQALAQQIYAGADIFLMPSRFEPCGLSQLIAMRYGTIPVVRSTGGLRDTVENVKINKKLFGLIKQIQGTGFVFNDFSLPEFISTIKRTLEFYQNKRNWKQLQIRVMKQDFSWSKSAQKYLELYKKLMDTNN